MDPQTYADLKGGHGLIGNTNVGGKRQVTVISQEQWQDALGEIGATAPPTARRANLMVSGLQLRDSRGRVLRIGACCIRVWGETRPCERMDQAHAGLREALKKEWRGGVYGEVLNDGRIAVGDRAAWVDD